MNDFLIVGTLVGLLFGLFHAIYMSKLVSNNAGTTSSINAVTALNFALWTIVLWLLMGGYLLGFWLIAVVFFIVFKVYR